MQPLPLAEELFASLLTLGVGYTCVSRAYIDTLRFIEVAHTFRTLIRVDNVTPCVF